MCFQYGTPEARPADRRPPCSCNPAAWAARSASQNTTGSCAEKSAAAWTIGRDGDGDAEGGPTSDEPSGREPSDAHSLLQAARNATETATTTERLVRISAQREE